MLQAGQQQVWNINPLIMTVDDFLSPEECTALMSSSNEGMNRAAVINSDGTRSISETRTNLAVSVAEEVAMPFKFKTGMLLRMPVTYAEPVQLLHYRVGNEFSAHLDGFPIGVDGEHAK
ncbi:MAG: hypothetical protein AAF439_01765, partial [Pseudomonadota bacterium]